MKGIVVVVVVALFAAALAADEEADVVVVGAGAAGLSAAVAATRDNPATRVLVLEKGAKYGGTSIRSGGRLWIPNNEDLDGHGITDAKLDALKYMARMAHPDVFSADKEFLGLGQRHYELIEAYYDNGRDVTSWMRNNSCLSWEAEKINFMLRKSDPLNLTGQLEPDYWPLIPENKVGRGRTIAPFKFNPKDPRHGHSIASGSSLGGPDLMNWLHYGCTLRNVTLRYHTAVIDLVMLNNTDGTQYVDAVVSVDVKSGAQKQIKVKKGVVFATGGFSKDKAKMSKYIPGPITGGGCGVNTNTGDFIDIALKHGFLLDNMERAWFIENIYEQWMKDPRSEHGLVPSYLLFQAYWLQGDSMFQVNSRGKRVCNEKSPYNERTQSHFYYDDSVHDYTNRYEINIFDHHTLKHFWGPPGQILPDVLSYKDIKIGPADDMPTLVKLIKQRLAALANTTGNFQLQADFESNIQQTLNNFNKYATIGVDPEFNRGLSITDIKWHSFCLNLHGVDFLGIHDCITANVDEHGKRYPNPTMRPLAPPYYAVIMSSGLQDTNGGPAINAQAQVLDLSERPVGKLYGAGNCIGAPAGNAYWGAGSTLGPAVVFGHIAGRNAAK